MHDNHGALTNGLVCFAYVGVEFIADAASPRLFISTQHFKNLPISRYHFAVVYSWDALNPTTLGGMCMWCCADDASVLHGEQRRGNTRREYMVQLLVYGSSYVHVYIEARSNF